MASEKNAWLNNVVAVGLYRPDLGKIAYRVYRILEPRIPPINR